MSIIAPVQLSPDLLALQKAADKAAADYRGIRQGKDAWIANHVNEIKKQAAAMFDNDMSAAWDAEYKARHAYEQALVKARNADTGWLPVGTKVVKVSSTGYYGGRAERRTYGVLEVWGPDSVFPENHSSFRRPSAGKLVVRLLRQDGTQSKTYDDGLWHGDHGGWKEAV